jgi:hypothetical protein
MSMEMTHGQSLKTILGHGEVKGEEWASKPCDEERHFDVCE